MGILFINSHRAKSGIVGNVKLPRPYILLCKFFDCGVIDRTHSLDVGFDQVVLDEIPDPTAHTEPLTFDGICDRVVRGILDEAAAKDQKIRVLWSGGIDSTVALAGLLRNPEAGKHRLEVILSMNSINEYPLFFQQYISGHLPFTVMESPISHYFDADALIVTGEHGDQLFGSDKLLPLIVNKLAYESYEVALPIYLTNRFGDSRKVDIIMNYLEPLVRSCPHDIHTMFDLFWWLNFTVKWQQVSLRMAVFSFKSNVKPVYQRLRHFFRDDAFQVWSLNNHAHRAAASLETYKEPAKKYILDFTGDPSFYKEKTKEPSLKHVIIDRKKQGNQRYRVMMKEDFAPTVEIFHKKNRNKKIVL